MLWQSNEVCSIKRCIIQSPNFILPSASFGLHLKSESPISLIKFADAEHLYIKQINAIRQVWPNANIHYITGFNCDKIDSLLKKEHVNIVHNLDYDKTTICYSLKKKLDNLGTSPICIIYGNVFFDKELLTNYLKNVIIDAEQSQGIALTSFNLDKKNLGIGPNGYFDYAFKEKWAKIIYLKGKFVEFFQERICRNPHYCLHEILNMFGPAHLYLTKVDIHNSHLLDIKQSKHVKFINENYLGKRYGK